MRFAHLLISVPLFFGVSQFVQPASLALAEGMTAVQATQLLAKSNAINTKCNILSANKSQEMRDYIARAEISLAEKSSVAVARKAIAMGKEQGKNAVCDEAARKLVNDVLAAANAAVSVEIADATTPLEPEPKAAEPVVKPEAKAVAIVEPEPVAMAKPAIVKAAVESKKAAPKPVVAKKPDVKKPSVVVQNTKKILKIKTKSLGTYAAVAEKYYMARRCGMSARQINSLYETVLTNHKQAMATSRARDVRAMLKAAEARAGSKSCG
jgi:hypothetical protein